MVLSLLRRVKGHINGEPISKGKVQEFSIIGPLSSMLGPSGRITLASLKYYFQESSKGDFIEFVQNPVLAGSALTAERLSAPDNLEDETHLNNNVSKINRTQIVNLDDQISKKSGPGTSLPYAIYPLIKRINTDSPAHSFTIGRTKNNDMSMQDTAISKTHAVIRISKGAFYIEDRGSTNGSRTNGRRLTDKPEKLQDKDIIELGNYEFTFLYPVSLHDLLSKS
jgi:hypothetical protein